MGDEISCTGHIESALANFLPCSITRGAGQSKPATVQCCRLLSLCGKMANQALFEQLDPELEHSSMIQDVVN